MTTLVITGVHRSGTSLLWLLLNRHPEIALMYEAGFLKTRPLLNKNRNRKNWAPRLDFWTGAFSRHRLIPGDFSEARTASAAFDASTRAYGRRKGASVIGEKLPAYCTELPSIARQLPESKILVVWRDPVDVLASVERAAKSQSGATFQRSDRFSAVLRDVDRLLAGVKILQARNFPIKIVSLSALQAKPEETLSEVCDFLQISNSVDWMKPIAGESVPVPSTPNNEKVRSGALAASGERGASTISPEIQTYLARWMQYWRATYPQFVFLGQSGVNEPSLSPPDRLDRLRLTKADWKDALKVWLFTCCPLWLWRRYRAVWYHKPKPPSS